MTTKEVLSIAPMLGVTNKFFRHLLRYITKETVLYSEMLVADTLLHTKVLDDYLKLDEIEHPIVCQLAGSNPDTLYEASRIVKSYKYDGINLNCGCPSDKASDGEFGARLMLKAELVRDICHSINRENDINLTVKCRIGVDDHDSYEELCNFIRIVSSSGVKHFIIHARKCILNGLSTIKNLLIPPIKYEWVYRLMKDFPDLDFSLNGNVKTIEDAYEKLNEEHDGRRLNSVMIGRAAYNNPWNMYKADEIIFHKSPPRYTRGEILEDYMNYVERLNSVRERNYSLAVVTSPIYAFMKGCKNVGEFRRSLNDLVVIQKKTDLRYCLEECLGLIDDEDLNAIGVINHNSDMPK